MTNHIDVLASAAPGQEEILTDEARSFIGALTAEFQPRIEELLAARVTRQIAINKGEMPDFLEETRNVRESDWMVGEIPDDLTDRRVEITGPTDRKMIINALNSGAKVFMADCEDSMTPTWASMRIPSCSFAASARSAIRARPRW